MSETRKKALAYLRDGKVIVHTAFPMTNGRKALNGSADVIGQHSTYIVQFGPDGPDCQGVDAMSTISGAHEEVSIYGTGIVHVPLIGRPEFAGLAFDAAGVATATVKDGALALATDDIDLLMAWRNAFQAAIAAMNIHQQRAEGRS